MLLEPADVAALAEELPDWHVQDGRLRRHFGFRAFLDGLAFVQRVADVAEAQHHHPDVRLRWGSVDLELWTHDSGGLTAKDVRLAHACDALFRG